MKRTGRFASILSLFTVALAITILILIFNDLKYLGSSSIQESSKFISDNFKTLLTSSNEETTGYRVGIIVIIVVYGLIDILWIILAIFRRRFLQLIPIVFLNVAVVVIMILLSLFPPIFIPRFQALVSEVDIGGPYFLPIMICSCFMVLLTLGGTISALSVVGKKKIVSNAQ